MTAPAIGHGDLAEELGLVHAAVTQQSAGLLGLANCILHALHIERLVWDSMTFSAAVSSLSNHQTISSTELGTAQTAKHLPHLLSLPSAFPQ
jgi:hypothetical protein